MGLFVLAWLTGEGIIAWRSVSQQHMPPSPREMIVASGLFALLALLAEYEPAKFVATAFAWGVDIAVLMQVLPGGTDPITASQGKSGWASIGTAGNTVVIPDGTAASAITAATTSATSSGGGSPVTTVSATGGTPAANQQVAQQIISANSAYSGWNTGGQWQCLDALWERESSWLTSATNPHSGAYGIAQSLHGTIWGQGGNEYNPSDPEGLSPAQLQGANNGNAADQIAWGLAYILDTYGSPCAAWQHEQTAGWY